MKMNTLVRLVLGIGVLAGFTGTLIGMSRTSEADIVAGQYSLEVQAYSAADGTPIEQAAVGVPFVLKVGIYHSAAAYQAVQWSVDYDEALLTVPALTAGAIKDAAAPPNCGSAQDNDLRVLLGCIDIFGPNITYSGNAYNVPITCAANGETSFSFLGTTAPGQQTFVRIGTSTFLPIHVHNDASFTCGTVEVPTNTPTATNTAPANTATHTPTATRTATATATNTVPANTATHTATATRTATATATNTAPANTATHTPTATNTVPGNTATPTPTATNTVPANTATNTPTATNTVPVNTATNTPTATNTVPVNTATNTPTATNTVPVNTATNTPTATNTVPANTATNTPTATNTVPAPPTNTPTATRTPGEGCFGDLNGDGKVSGQDVAIVARNLSRQNLIADVNGDDKVSLIDLKLVIKAMHEGDC